jgi:hypothetical protein
MWFEGGEAVLSEPVGELQKVIHSIESGAEEKSVFAEEVQGESHLEQTNSGPQSQVFLKFQMSTNYSVPSPWLYSFPS